MPYHHGVTLTEVTEGPRYIRDAKTSTIGLVATADDADAAAFPLNAPVLIAGDVTILDKAGTTGTLAKTLDAIFDQGAPLIVVVRVSEGIDEAATTTNVIGGAVNGQLTGLQGLLAAKARFGFAPRILGCPGLDTQAVAAELIAIADKLRGFAYLSAWGQTTQEDVILYRDNFGSKRAMLIWPEFTGWDTVNSQTVELNAVARAIGLRAYIDHEMGWHKSLSNVPVQGVTGFSKDIHWDLRDPNTTAGILNTNDITTIIREGGFRFWGSRTLSIDPKEAFESVVRTGDMLGDTIADAHLWAIDKPMTRVLVYDLLEGINAKLRELKALGRIVDGKAWIDDAKNDPTTLEAGMLYLDYDYVAVPPLENLLLTQRINSEYLIQLVS